MIKYIKNNEYEVLTKNGFKNFDGLKTSKSNKLIKLTFNDNTTLECTYEHQILLDDDDFYNVESLKIDDITSNKLKIIKIEQMNESKKVYDLVNVEHEQSYITNGIISHNCLYIDEGAFVASNMWEEFYTSVYPTISSSKKSQVILVSTPNGMNHYHKLWKDAINKKNEYVPCKVIWSDVPGRDEQWKKTEIANTSEKAFAQEQEVDFIGSASTLFDMKKVAEIAEENPIKIEYNDTFYIYEDPIPEHLYTLCCDIGEGKSGDFSVINIIDITTLPYKQVAILRSDKIATFAFPEIIATIANRYNEGFVLVECNSIGTSITDALFYNIEYENLICSVKKSKNSPHEMCFLNTPNREVGLRTTKATKKIGCNNIKQIFDNRNIIIQDHNTVSEMSTFVKKSNKISFSYEADGNDKHDDIVMTLVLFGWLINQEGMKDITNKDIRKIISNSLLEENDINFIGFHCNGIETQTINANPDNWSSWCNN